MAFVISGPVFLKDHSLLAPSLSATSAQAPSIMFAESVEPTHSFGLIEDSRVF
jgi:hypothetical protein